MSVAAAAWDGAPNDAEVDADLWPDRDVVARPGYAALGLRMGSLLDGMFTSRREPAATPAQRARFAAVFAPP